MTQNIELITHGLSLEEMTLNKDFNLKKFFNKMLKRNFKNILFSPDFY